MVALLTASKTLPLWIRKEILELSCSVFGLGYLEEGFFTFLTHLLFALKEFLHDFFEFFLQSIGFSL
jgi:hypothetical protein